MGARQRLRIILEARRANQTCWHCALNTPRYNSTSAAGIPDSSNSTDNVFHGGLPQQGNRDTFISSLPYGRPGFVDESNVPGMRGAQKPRTRVEADGQPVATGTRSKSQSTESHQESPIRLEPHHGWVGAVKQGSSRSESTETSGVDWVNLDPGIRVLADKPSEYDGLLVRRVDTTKTRLFWKNFLDKGPEVHWISRSLRLRKVLSDGPAATPLASKAGSPLKERSTDSSEGSSEHQSENEALISVLNKRRELHTSELPGHIQGAMESGRLMYGYTIHKVVSDGPAATPLASKAGSPLKERSIDSSEGPSEHHSENEASHDALMSVLDMSRKLHTSELPGHTEGAMESGRMIRLVNGRPKRTRVPQTQSDPSTGFSPKTRFFRWRFAHPSRTWARRQNLDALAQSSSTTPTPSTGFSSQNSLIRLFDVRRSRRPSSTVNFPASKRHHATATSRTLRADAPIDPSILGRSPEKTMKIHPGGIREALKMWQEQYDIAVAIASDGPLSSTSGDTQNIFTQSVEDESFITIARDDEMEDDFPVVPEPDEPVPGIFARQIFLRRGDLVDLQASSEPVLAIFVRNLPNSCQFYTIRGQWVSRPLASVQWAVPHFVNPKDLDDILPYLPAEAIAEDAEDKMNHLQTVDAHAPRDAGAKIIEQMRVFHLAANAVFREHAARISRLYEIIAPSEGFTDRTYMSLKDIAMKVLLKEDPSELTQPMMWAIHRAIVQCQNITWDRMNYRQNPIYEINPQQGLKSISQVREWVREYQEEIIQDTTNEKASSIDSMLMAATRSLNPIATFVKKARAAIQQGRQTRPLSESGHIGPSSTRIGEGLQRPYIEICLQLFSNDEKTIIHYLDVWATSSYVNIHTNLASLGPMILRATGLYEGFELDQSRGFTLLQELGVIKPWENRTVYSVRNLNIPGPDGETGEASRLLSEANKEAEVFEPKDAMEGLRKDWGDMPVFCIDSADTSERDDGVSLELVDHDPSAYWVHVHVANPSSFIPPDSSMAGYAASLAQSIYFPEKRYPMLNEKVTKARLSLANDRPCITFSAKISVDGDTLEKKVTPGIVRNVHYLTPRTVSQGLGLTETDEEPGTVSILTVGGRMPTRRADQVDQTAEGLTDPGHIKVLRKLLELGTATSHKQFRAGVRDFSSDVNESASYPVVYQGGYPVRHCPINNNTIKLFKGDPIISVQRTRLYGLVSKMVSDLMIIAGGVAASWCSERNIPVPYRGILRNPEPASPPDVFRREILEPQIAKDGRMDPLDIQRYQRLIGEAYASDRPFEHVTLGLPAYCRATSPLRRHIDLYTHWQIEAAIRHEAATGTSLIGSTDESYLPFSRAQVEEYASGALHRERTLSSATSSSVRHWVCQALFRAFHFHEASLPETFEVAVDSFGSDGPGRYGGWLVGWKAKVRLRDGGSAVKEVGWRAGDVWEARIVRVDTYRMHIIMDAIRLVVGEGGRVVG